MDCGAYMQVVTGRIRKIAKSDYWHGRVSVCPHGTTRLQTGRIFMKFYISVLFGKKKQTIEKILVSLISDNNSGYFT